VSPREQLIFLLGKYSFLETKTKHCPELNMSSKKKAKAWLRINHLKPTDNKKEKKNMHIKSNHRFKTVKHKKTLHKI